MPYSPILIVHICAGTLGLLSGTAAMSFRKGSPRHVLAGKIFVASMLTMAVLAVYLAIVRHQPNNIGGGILTFYLIGTGWLTAKRRDGVTSRFDWVVLLIPLALGTLTWMNGLKVVRSGASSQDGVPVGMTFFMGSVMLVAGAGDELELLLLFPQAASSTAMTVMKAAARRIVVLFTDSLQLVGSTWFSAGRIRR